jgi:hypothetical protein
MGAEKMVMRGLYVAPGSSKARLTPKHVIKGAILVPLFVSRFQVIKIKELQFVNQGKRAPLRVRR